MREHAEENTWTCDPSGQRRTHPIPDQQRQPHRRRSGRRENPDAGTECLCGNATAIRSGWVSAQDGLLAVDGNGNGRIDSIHERFGGLNKGDGVAELQSCDSNGEGWVDASDARFDELRVWQDADSDRVTDGGEPRTLAEAGIAALRAGFVEKPFIDAPGTCISSKAVPGCRMASLWI